LAHRAPSPRAHSSSGINYFGYGLIVPFEIIYLHQIRGFSTSTAGLVLAATMGTAAIVTPPTGALLDRYSAKAIVVAGSLASALGYAGFAYVDLPWQAFACSIVSGAGIGLAGTANRVLIITLVKREQRAASVALGRVVGNYFGLGFGATVAGFIVASAQRLNSFQTLYFFDAVYTRLTAHDLAEVVRVFDQAGDETRIQRPSPRDENSGATNA
jgi:MFS family permease